MYSPELASVFIAILAAAVGLAILWVIIRTSVRTALRDHQEWLDAGKPTKDAAEAD